MQINIIDYLEKTAAKHADRTAVIDGEKSILFGDLNNNAKKLSRMISDHLDGMINRPVAVFTKKSIGSVLSDLAIIYSGNAYMNLDVKTPISRIQAVLQLIDPALLITDGSFANVVEDIWPIEKTINLDTVSFDLLVFNQHDVDRLLGKVIDTDPLCIINTSGSTGTPKGVVLNHRSFIDFTEWSLETMCFSDHEILGCLSPIVFDIYSYELCLLMAKGATMMLIQDTMAAFPVKILQLMNKHHVSFIFWVPTIMTNIANMGLLDKVPLNDLKTVWFAGEVFQTKQFNIWRKALPQALFVNLYGPIEITLDCTYYIVDRELSNDEPIPIGLACKNTDILILNAENKRAEQDEEGELCVRGSSSAMGYYNNPEKTAAAFVQNPLNNSYPELIYRTGDIALINVHGEIMFKGRKDTLVKHSGYRIELSEIEHVIVNSLQLVKNGCIIYNHDVNEIVLFYEPYEDLSVAEMKKRIATALPKYMIPTIYVCMDELPKNTNGKIDRLMLKGMTHA
jgi:amino acid adenylation domain-containing protein